MQKCFFDILLKLSNQNSHKASSKTNNKNYNNNKLAAIIKTKIMVMK